MPGLVNLHTHLPMTLLRGLAENLDLQGFLEHLWAAEAAVMDPETVELGATLGALESLLGGCTTQLDMYFHHEATHRGAVAAGSRHVIGPVFFDGPGPDGLAWSERLAGLRAWPGVLDEIGGPEVPVSAMPHATYTCSPEGLTEVVETLRKVLTETGRPGVLTTHVSETAAENAGIRERYDATPTELLSRTGWLEPDLPLVLAHGVHLTATDRELVAAAGAAIGHCPGSNLKLASGALHWEEVRAGGIRLGVGTDGCSSSNDLDMWQAMRQVALVARLTSGRPDVASATEVLRAATIDGARALGLGDRDRLGRGRQAGRPRAPRPRRAPPDAGARRRGPAGLRGRPRRRHRRARRRRPRGARPAQHQARHRRPPRPRRRQGRRRPGRGGGAVSQESAEQVIARLKMQPIPEEGAWFVAGPRTQNLNAITVLLTDQPEGFSAMHRLTIDEGWQWLGGAPAALLRLRPGGSGVLNYVGPTTSQFLVRRGTWMGASTLGAWTLLSCWCSPAFRPEHFELGDRTLLTAGYPSYAAEIAALTRDEPVGRMR